MVGDHPELHKIKQHPSNCGQDSPYQSSGNMAPHRQLRMNFQSILDVPIPIPPHDTLHAHATSNPTITRLKGVL